MKRFIKIVFTFIALLTFTLVFSSNVMAVNMTDQEMVETDVALVTVPEEAIISFPVAIQSPYDNQFLWTSSNEDVLKYMDGWFVVTRPVAEDALVTVTVEVSRPLGEYTKIREFDVLIPKGITHTRTFTITYENVLEAEVEGLKKEYKLGEASFALESPVSTDGKVFIGWYADAELTQEVKQVVVGTQGNLTLYALWDIPATYKVIHYGEPLSGGEPVVLHEETLNSFVGHSVSTEPLEFEGFTNDPDHENQKLNGIVQNDGSLELRVYYARNEYTVTFDTQGGSEVEAVTAKYQAEVLAPAAPTKVGYEFIGWSAEFPFEVLDDMTVTANWKPALVDYKVYYYGADLDGAFEEFNIVTKQALTGAEVTLTPEVEFIGFSYLAEHVDEVNFQVIEADGSSIFKFYFERNSYTVTYDLDGGLWEVPTVVTYKFEAQVVEPTEIPVKEAYSFAGWDKAFPFTMPAEDVVITVQWTELPTYIVTFESNGGSAVSAQSVIEGSQALQPEDPTKQGYQFIGWVTADEQPFDFNTPITASGLVTLFNTVFIWRPVYIQLVSNNLGFHGF